MAFLKKRRDVAENTRKNVSYTAKHSQEKNQPVDADRVLRDIDRNRKKIRAEYPDFSNFIQHYEVPQSLIDDIIAQAAEKDVKPKDDEELQATVPDLKFTLKALVAYDIWDRNEYFRIINEKSDIVKRALEVLESGT